MYSLYFEYVNNLFCWDIEGILLIKHISITVMNLITNNDQTAVELMNNNLNQQ